MFFENEDGSKRTKIVFGSDARKELLVGLETAAKAVGCTLGPKGKCVIIQRDGQTPVVTKDGVSVAKAVNLQDPVARMGAELVKEAAGRTNEVAGDGTTTATVLTHALVSEGVKLLTAGFDSRDLCTGIEAGVRVIVSSLKQAAEKIDSSEKIAQVGTVSANGDASIGELIAQAMERVGQDGIITVEDAKGMSTSLEVVDGMQFERGFLSPYFVTNQEKMNCVYENASVLLTDKKVSNLADLVPMLEEAHRVQKPLLIVAEDVDQQALQLLIVNKLKTNMPVVAIRAPGAGHLRDAVLHDIATMAGSTVVSAATGMSLKDVRLSHLGNLKKVSVDAKTSTLVGDGKHGEAVKRRVEDLRAQMEDVTLSNDERETLRMRVAKLSAGVAVIKVGGLTELEIVEKKYRIEDALNATRAAVAEGIVPGGGMALYTAAKAPLKAEPFAEAKGVQMGIDVVRHACSAPLRKIAENAGVAPDVVLMRVNAFFERSGNSARVGYNAAADVCEDLVSAGIIDPVKVTRTALENAASVAITFLSLDAVITEETMEKT